MTARENAVSTTRIVLLPSSLLYPVTSLTCDNTMLTATPVRNPLITEFDTNLTRVPARTSAEQYLDGPNHQGE